MSEYPGITKAAFEIAYDNGGINRYRSANQVQKELRQWLAYQPQEILGPIDLWLSSLSEDQLRSVCSGDGTEDEDLLASAPPFTDSLLQDYFDEVC